MFLVSLVTMWWAVMPTALNTCDSDADCNGNRYCQKAVGDCDGEGVCKRPPRNCTEEYNPVCGCDGVTYSNACHARQARINIAHAGECDPVGKCCLEVGGCITATAAECADACGTFAGGGTSCTGLPLDCPIPPIVVAACCLPGGDCDILTQCQCNNAGGTWQAVADCGVADCATGGASCGGFLGVPCEDPDQFCKLGVGECCCDFEGVCTDFPLFCPLFFDPVCGCDGVTYSNQCFADSAGVSVDFLGACDGGGTGDCFTNSDCVFLGPLFGQYCAKPAGTCNGPGTCTVAPQFCLDVYDPVCGCDGNTYSNACYANRVGVNVANEGTCGF